MAVGHLPVSTYDPVQVRRMGARRHRRRCGAGTGRPCRRSLEAGFDVVYVYAAHGLNTIGQFLSRKYNERDDGYGGSLENRARLLREILEDTLDEVDGRAAVACRITVDELVGADGIDRPDIEGVLGLVGELPDVWDFVVGEWENDSVDLAVRPGGGPRAVRPRPEGAHVASPSSASAASRRPTRWCGWCATACST